MGEISFCERGIDLNEMVKQSDSEKMRPIGIE